MKNKIIDSWTIIGYDECYEAWKILVCGLTDYEAAQCFAKKHLGVWRHKESCKHIRFLQVKEDFKIKETYDLE